jgi:hypothetical protein
MYTFSQPMALPPNSLILGLLLHASSALILQNLVSSQMLKPSPQPMYGASRFRKANGNTTTRPGSSRLHQGALLLSTSRPKACGQRGNLVA